MPSFISDSSQRYALATLAIFLSLTAGALLLIEHQARRFDKQASSSSLRILHSDIPYDTYAVIGTSHSRQRPPAGARFIKAVGPMTVPTVMYFKAKKITELQPTIQAVYLEADYHLFFNGKLYSLEGLSPVERARHPIFQNWREYLDSTEARRVFGEVHFPEKNRLLALEDNVRPIILKRIATHIIDALPGTREKEQFAKDPCSDPSLYRHGVPDLSQKSTWANFSPEKKKKYLRKKLSLFELKDRNALSPLMIRYYEKTIELFIEHGIHVVLVRYPLYTTYLNNIHPANRQQVDDYLQRLTRTYNLDVINLTMLHNTNVNFFENADHVAREQQLFIGKVILEDFCTRRHTPSPGS